MSLRLIQAALFLALAACGSSSPTTAQPNNSDRPFQVGQVATFNSPWAMAFLPGSGQGLANVALVTEKPGGLWLIDVSSGRKQPVAGAPAVVAQGQGGLLDVVVSPRFASDGRVYLTYSEPRASGGSGLALARAQLVRDASGARLRNPTVLWRNPSGGQGGHFGARIAFAPDGNSLFLSAGERQRFTPAQDPSQPLGKILHLTLDGEPAPGNPFVGRAGASSVTITDPPENSEIAKRTAGRSFAWPGPNLTPAETWSGGHRNPLGIGFAPDGRLWAIEMGPAGGDEVNLILPGRNYGWPLVSNGDNYDGVPIRRHSTRPDLEAPKVWWNPSVSPAGLLIYTGDLFPEWKGDALIPALSGQALIHVRIRGDQATKADQWNMGKRIRAAAQGPRGEVYLLEDGPDAQLLRLTPAAR